MKFPALLNPFLLLLFVAFGSAVSAEELKRENQPGGAAQRPFNDGADARPPTNLAFTLRNDLLGYNASIASFGIAVADADGDGDPDIWLGQHGDRSIPVILRNRLNEAGGSFETLAHDQRGDRHGATWVDIDGDGARELLLLRGGGKGGKVEKPMEDLGNILLVNRAIGDGGIDLHWPDDGDSDRDSRGLYYSHGRGRTATFLDANHDCRLDVVIANSARPDGAYPTELFIQRQDGNFAAASGSLGVAGNGLLLASPADFDGDGVIDLFFTGERVANTLALGGKEKFSEANARLPEALREVAAEDTVVADFNGDLRPDIWLVTKKTPRGRGGQDRLFLNTGTGFVEASAESGIAGFAFNSRNATFGDFDNDGDVDVYAVNGDYGARKTNGNLPNVIWENRGNTGSLGAGKAVLAVPEFVPHSGAEFAPSDDNGLGATVAAGEFNGDGILDLLVGNGANGGKLHPGLFSRGAYDLYLGADRGGNRWLMVEFDAPLEGIGAIVTATVAGRKQLRTADHGVHAKTQNDPRLHFGFGATASDARARLDISWPGGLQQVVEGVELNQVVRIAAPASGSSAGACG